MRVSDRTSVAQNLDLAWSQIGNSNSDLDLPDLIAFADFQASWDEQRQLLTDKILSDDYKPGGVDVVDLPKDRLTVRPLSRLALDRRLAYEAAVLASAPVIDSHVPRSVYSSRWWKRKQRLLGPAGSWLRMRRAARSIHRHNPDLLLARTDVTSFYEYVEIDILISDLESLSLPEWSVELLGNFLHSFNDLGNVWGIPQGFDVSGILANLYLLPIDQEVARRGLTHFRYSDDIYIFGRDWLSLRQIALDITATLRHRHLILSGHKTKIINSHLIAQEFEDMDKDAINYGIGLGSLQSRVDLQKFFDETVAADPPSTRDLRFTLSQLGRIIDDHAVRWLISNLGEIPHIAREALFYLAKFHRSTLHLGEAIVDLLTNSKLVLYPYAEQHLLIYLIRQGVRTETARQAAWRLLLDRNKESFVREFAARYLGLYGRAGDGARLKQEFQQETNVHVRRALLVACYESGACTTSWIRSVESAVPDLAVTAKYLKASPSVIPMPIVRTSL